VKTYQTAYGQVEKVQLGSALPLQHWYELTRVAEQVHIKVKPWHCRHYDCFRYYIAVIATSCLVRLLLLLVFVLLLYIHLLSLLQLLLSLLAQALTQGQVYCYYC